MDPDNLRPDPGSGKIPDRNLDPVNLIPDPQLGMHYAYRDRHTAGILLGAIKHIDKEVAFDSETYLDKCYLIY